jgi:hypothetical protein
MMTDVPMRFGAVLSLVLSLVWLPATGRIEFPGATPTLDRPNGRRRHQFSAGLDRSARASSCGARVPYRRLHTEVPSLSRDTVGFVGIAVAKYGIETHVIQPSSVPVDRRARRAKSDGIDADLLLRTLLAWLRGETRVCSMVPIPAETNEDARRLVRERAELVSERVGLVNRIVPSWRLWVGEYNLLRRDQRRGLDELQTAPGDALPMHARAR